MEREKFEESWKKAFDKAEISPSDNVWTNIELGLEKAKGGDLKKRLIFYQMLAAASVAFAMAIGGAGFYYVNNEQQSTNNLALQEAPIKTERPLPLAEGPAINEKKDDLSESSEIQNLPKNDNNTNGSLTQKSEVNRAPKNTADRGGDLQDYSKSGFEDQPKDFSALLADNKDHGSRHDLPTAIDDKDLPAFYQPRKIDLHIPDETEEIDPVVAMLARLDQREKQVSGEEKATKEAEMNKNENLWTSVGFAAGSFNTVHSSVSSTSRNSMMAMNAPIVDEEAKASGYAYSVGVNVGTKVAERWVFQGGVNYLTHSSDYTAHNAVAASSSFQSFKPAGISELVKNADHRELNEKIVYTAPYSINNSLRYLSIPMQAGYLLVNKSFGLQVNAGIATDLFLQNTLKGEGDNLDNTRQSGGADSPYRSVNLSGLFGTELSYRFSEHYRVALNPGVRYPFNTIYKSELDVQASPLTFDVGLRFRYIFH